MTSFDVITTVSVIAVAVVKVTVTSPLVGFCTCMLDPDTAAVGSKKEVAEVIAHEMAHQWFGDLVTTAW